MTDYDPYWQLDLSLGEGVFSNMLHRPVSRSIRMLLHVATDDGSFIRQEIVPITAPAGVRTVVHARPYRRHTVSWLGTLLSRLLYGRVLSLPSQTLGDCQAWYYHAEQLLVL